MNNQESSKFEMEGSSLVRGVAQPFFTPMASPEALSPNHELNQAFILTPPGDI